jgi:hypothetical protein
MPWNVSKLSVDFNSDRATVALDSSTAPASSITLEFTMPDKANLKKPDKSQTAQVLDDVTRKALTAQAKRLLTDAASSL